MTRPADSMVLDVQVQRLDSGVPLPSYAHPGDAGADLVAAADVTLQPGERELVPTGLALALPHGYAAFVHPRSGLAARCGLSIVNAPGTVDAGYRGEVKVLLVNLDPREPIRLRRGDRIAQLVIQRVEAARFVEVSELPASERGAGGYGSTGGFAAHLTAPPGGTPLMFSRRRGTDRPERSSTPVPIPGTEEPERAELPRPQGPWDAGDVEIGPDDPDVVDLGGLLVRGRPGLEVRLQVDERTQAVAAALLVSTDGAVELRPFAAPRNESVWDDVRREIGAEATRRGGTATEQQGAFGAELHLAVPVQNPEGQHGTQVSRVVGVSAPRWLLRGTFLGRPATEPDPEGDLELAFRDVVVRRGGAPMAPRAPIPLQLPPGAQAPDPTESPQPGGPAQ